MIDTHASILVDGEPTTVDLLDLDHDHLVALLADAKEHGDTEMVHTIRCIIGDDE